MMSFHIIANMAWFGLAPSCCLSHSSAELGQPKGLLHGREDLVLQQLPVAELVDPQQTKIVHINVDFLLDILLRFYEYLSQK
jgi:hypothetical protein